MLKNIIHPDSHSKLFEITNDFYLFEDDSKLPIHEGTPILFSAESIFSKEDIVNSKKTTQDSSHLDTSNIKNYVRRKLLPSLCEDFNLERRYETLSKCIPVNSKIVSIRAASISGSGTG